MFSSLFHGIRVLDLTKVLSGPLATRYLADYGAEVIKIEHRDQPDPSRNLPPLVNGWSGYYEMLNRNKKSITLDLTDSADREKFYKLVKDADILVENLTPSVKGNLKIDYETLTKFNSKLIYASLAGIDQATDRKYFDVIAQAESGLLSLNGTPEQAMKIGPAVIDAFSGVTLAFSIVSALYHRERTGSGQFLTVSMLASAMNLLEQNLIEYSITQQNPRRQPTQDTAIAPFGIFKTQDGSIVVAVGSEMLWQKFTQLFSDLKEKRFATNEMRLKHSTELTAAIEAIFSQLSTQELVILLHAHTIPAASIREMSDVAQEEWFFSSGALLKLSHPKVGEYIVPGTSIHFGISAGKKSPKPAPGIGDNNNEFDIHS